MRRSIVLVLWCALPAAAEAPSPAARIVGAALIDGHAFATVQSLTDHVGQRLAGSPAADRAVAWAQRELEQAGLRNVRREPVKVPRWTRGEESFELLSADGPIPRAAQPIHGVALGNSVGTPPAGIVAEVVEAGSLAELGALGARAKGKIVLINKPMGRSGAGFEGYGAVVPLRGVGAVAAAKNGAVAALIRSVGTGAYRLPHTGGTHYDEKVAKIPFAAVSAEDADLLHRLIAGGEAPRVRLKLGCKNDGEVDSFNVVGEVPGRELPGEIVLLGAHLDSWDLGQGAIDDGAGVGIVIEAARLLVALGLPPRRTVRVVLYMNEEHGLSGAKAYAAQHAAELPRHVAALEADSGAGRPFGAHVAAAGAGGAAAVERVRKILAPLAPIRAATASPADEGGADLIPLQAAGVPVLGLAQDTSTYFDWHHTAADTLDKIDPIDLALDAAMVAVLAHGLAESTERLPPPPPPPKW